MIAVFPEIIRCIEENHIERLAILVRTYFGGPESRSPVIDLSHLIIHSGLQFIEKETPYHGALIVNDSKGKLKATIVCSPGLKTPERRFLLGHLLGHYFLNVQKNLLASQISTKGFGEDVAPLLRYESQLYSPVNPGCEEKYADQFAAALIMPSAMFRKAWTVLNTAGKVAEFFQTSKAGVLRRHQELNPGQESAKKPDGLVSSPSEPEVRVKARSTVEQKPLKRLRQLAKKLDDTVTV